MSQNQAKASERLSALIRADVAFMSPAMKNFQETLTLPIATQNVTAFG